MMQILEGVTWFRQSSVRIRRGGIEVHVDPWSVPDGSEGDFVLLTHPHYDSFSEEDVERTRGPDTVVVAPASMKKQLDDADHLLRPGDLLQLDGIDVLGVPAYNVARKFHPPGSGWLGYVFTVGGVTYYHAGHTDFLDSMHRIRCDVAFLPCDPRYTMDPVEAAGAADACGAKIVVPIHWGEAGASREDVLRIGERLTSARLVLLEPAA